MGATALSPGQLRPALDTDFGPTEFFSGVPLSGREGVGKMGSALGSQGVGREWVGGWVGGRIVRLGFSDHLGSPCDWSGDRRNFAR